VPADDAQWMFERFVALIGQQCPEAAAATTGIGAM
jgi:hypothetical protein